MVHFTVTRDVIRRISEIETPHGKALNEDISDEFPDNPDEAYTLAVGFSVATLLGSCGETRAGARCRWPQRHGVSHGLRADTGDLIR